MVTIGNCQVDELQ